MGNAMGLDHADLLQLNGFSAKVLEQPNPVAQQNGHEVEMHLIEQPGFQELLNHIRPAHQDDAIVACCLPRLCQRTLDSTGIKEVGSPALHHQRISGIVRDDENRHMELMEMTDHHFGLFHHMQRLIRTTFASNPVNSLASPTTC